MSRQMILDLPDELKVENLPRRNNVCTFDRIDLVIQFQPGKNNQGAIVKSFRDAIKAHDEMVTQLEAKITVVDERRKSYKGKNRLFRNLDNAWNVMLENPLQYNEYLNLLPHMLNIETKIIETTDPIEKVRLSGMHSKFMEIEQTCSRQHQVYLAFANAREARDEAVKQLLDSEKSLSDLKEQEKKLADLISDDHIMADELKKPLSHVFSNVQVGFILSQINGEHVESLPFPAVIDVIRRSKSPHKAIFLRYDYRLDPFLGVWRSLPELRELGICVEDPLLQTVHFISQAARGEVNSVHQMLEAGEDPNSLDLTGNNALMTAATNRHADVVKLLFKAGADIDLSDKNFVTPLLYCANRGYTDMAKLLLEMGADRTHVDRNLRGALYYSIQSGILDMVDLFFTTETRNVEERLWGFTPLHLACNMGALDIVNYLVEKGCSIYKRDKKGRIPEEVAIECGHSSVAKRLIHQRLNSAGQLVYEKAATSSESFQIWIGDVDSLQVSWCADVDVTAAIFICNRSENVPAHASWLKRENLKRREVNSTKESAGKGFAMKSPNSLVSFSVLQVKDLQADASNEENWDGLLLILPEALLYLKATLEREGLQRLLIADENGVCLAPALTAALLLLNEQIRVKDSVKIMQTSRPAVKLGKDIVRGLDELQQKMDKKLMKRLHKSARDSSVSSMMF